MVLADVVCAPLEKRDCQRELEGVANERQIALVELVLERLSPGRDDYLAAREQCRHQIGKSLPRAGARFRKQLAAFLDRPSDCFRHGKLLLPEPVCRKLARERTLRAENARELS